VTIAATIVVVVVVVVIIVVVVLITCVVRTKQVLTLHLALEAGDVSIAKIFAQLLNFLQF
jgi:hypothetical protein